MTVEFDERWVAIEQAARQLFPEIRENDGVSVGVVESAERRLGAPLPTLLRALYLRCGRRGDLLRSHEEVVPLDRLSVADGILVFAVENQGACKWGMSWPPKTDDPPVIRMDFTQTPVWEPDHDRLSGFLVWFVFWQAVNGGAPAGANGDADAGLVDRLGGWRELDRTGCHWNDTRFFLRSGQAVCVVGFVDPLVCAAARDGDAFALLDSAVQIDWNYTWPEP